MTLNTNLLQPTGFKVIINRKNFPALEWFAQSVDHPSVGLQQATSSYSRINEVPLPGDKLDFSEVTINIILDEELQAYQEVFGWMNRLVNTKYVPTTERSTLLPSSEHDMTLMILNSANTKQVSFIYRNAFPVNIGNLSMGAEAEASPILMPVSFQYTYFDIE